MASPADAGSHEVPGIRRRGGVRRSAKAASSEAHPVLSLHNVTFDYGGVRALSDVSLNLRAAEMHSLIGEHGAGKSTLGSVMSGYLRPRAGEIRLDGRPIHNHSPIVARRLGIHMVHQQAQLNENVTVAENLYYADDDRGASVFFSRRRAEAKADEILSEYGFSIDPRSRVRYLSPSDRTVLDILKNLVIAPRVLILDEALERVSAEAFERIVRILARLRTSGVAIVVITHRIDDIYAYSDRVTVLKDGVQLLTTDVDHISKLNLIRMAYTQVGTDYTGGGMNEEFQQYLRYNDAILQRLPINIIVVDPAHRVKLVNQYCRATFDLTEGRPRDLTLGELLAGHSDVVGRIESAIASGRSQTFYNVELTINGIRHVNNVKTSPIHDGLTVIGTVIIIEDVTEHDELQNQLILSEKLASVGLLAAGVAHEINNPLEIISNYLSYIRYRQPDGEVSESIEKVMSEIEYISNIVGNLVSFSSPKPRTPEVVDINRLVREILALLKYNAEYQHIEIGFTPAQDDAYFQGVGDEMKQVILNLIRNSLEAMPGGGTIAIATRADEENGCIVLDFADTGPGIDAEDPNSVFLPFYSTKKDRPDSLGLGLSISYRIVERTGGTMRVENLPERGCRFTVEVPAYRGGSDGRDTPAARASVS